MHEIAILAVIIGFFVILGLKGGAYHKALFYDKKAVEAKKHVPEMIEEAEAEEMEQEQCEAVLEETLENSQPKVKVRPEPLPSDEQAQAIQADRIIVNINELNLNDSLTSRNNNQVTQSRLTNTHDYKPGFMAGIREAQQNPWILTGYISSFLCYANVMCVNTVLVNYCTFVVGSEEGANQAYALTNKHMIVGCISAVFFGFFLDKYNKFKILMFVLIDSILAVLLLVLSPSPYNAMAYVSMVLFGISCSGLNCITSQLVSKYPNPKYRASVAAISSMTSMLGGAMISILGVFLSKYNPAIPFYMYLGAGGVAFVILCVLYSKRRNVLDKL